MTRYAYFGGAIVPIDEAKVSIMTHGLNYGTGCFEGIRAYWNDKEEQLYIFRPAEHYERLLRSCRIIRISLPHSVEELVAITVDLLRQEGFQEDSYVRPLAYKSSLGIGVRLHGIEDSLAIYALPFGKYIESEEGARVCVSSWRRIDDNMAPARAKLTGIYVNSALAKSEAMENGFDEAIVLNQDGHVSEGSAENLFIVRDGVLVTPPVTDNILEGITRATVIEIARERFGVPVTERTIDRSELYVADECFFCGTGVQIVAIGEVDRRPVGTGKMGPITRELRDFYFSLVRGNEPKYQHWCTAVYRK